MTAIPSLILTPNAYQQGAMLAHRPSLADNTKVIPVQIPYARADNVAMRRNKAGNWVTCLANQPRLSWNVGGTEASWLAESQRTNSLLRSTNFLTLWTITSATIANTVLPAPIQNVNWTRFTINTPSGLDRISQAITVAAGQIRTISVFLKGDTFNGSVLLRGDVSGNTANASINLATGVITNSGANLISSRMSVESDGIRLQLTFTTVLNPTIDIATFNTGVSGVSFLFTQIQLEDGSTASSPIITEGSAVTRLADVAALTGASALIGQTEGVLSAKINLTNFTPAVAKGILRLHNSGNTEAVELICIGDRFRVRTRSNGTLYTLFTTGSAFTLGVNTITLVYSTAAFKVFINGILVNTTVNAIAIPVNIMDRITFGEEGTNFLNDSFVKGYIYKNIISDTDAQSLNL